MTFISIADGAQLATLTKILDDYCREFGIANGDPIREDIGRHIMALYSYGYPFGQIELLLRLAPEKAA
jgi:hypothetical protein